MASPRTSRQLAPDQDIRSDQYRLVRVVGITNVQLLEKAIEDVYLLPSILPLNDGSHEVVVHESLYPIFEKKLKKLFPGSEVNEEYNPLNPTAAALEDWGLEQATELYKDWFRTRGQTQVKHGWDVAADVYAQHLAIYGLSDERVTPRRRPDVEKPDKRRSKRFYVSLILLLVRCPGEIASSALESMRSEIVYIHDFSNSTLLVVPDQLHTDIREAFGARAVECDDEPEIMTTLCARGWSNIEALSQFRGMMSAFRAEGALEACDLIRGFIRREVSGPQM